MKNVFSFIKVIVTLAIKLVLLLFEAVFWVIHAGLCFFGIGRDMVKAGRSMQGGVLHCPRGHAVPLGAGQVYECGACGFVYEGSFLICPNPECQAPITPYVNCPVCGLSIRSPFRWGSP